MATQSSFGAFRDQLVSLLLNWEINPQLQSFGAKLNLAPATVLTASGPLLLRHFIYKPKVVQASGLLWSKLAIAIALLAVEVVALTVNQASLPRYRLAQPASISCISTPCLIILLYFEHGHTLRSTATMAVWLIATMLQDAVELWQAPSRLSLEWYPLHIFICFALKAAILMLEEVPKRSSIIDDAVRNTVDREATSGFLTRSFLLWLHRIFSFGFKNVLSIEQLDNLAPEFSSEQLFNRLAMRWVQVDKEGPFPLARACLQTLFLPFISVIPSRIFCIAFTMSQVMFIYEIVGFTERASGAENIQPNGNSLVTTAVAIYLGIAVSKAISAHLTSRYIVLTRGMLVSQIYHKSLELYYTEAQAAAAVTHMGADIDGVAAGIAKFHDMWADVVQLGIGTYLLTLLMGSATAFFFIPTIINLYTAWRLVKRTPTADALWNQTIQTRVSETTAMLSQLRAVRMIGLDKVVSRPIELLQRDEVKHCVAVGEWMATRLATIVFCDAMTGPILMAGGLFWTTFSAGVSTKEMYTMLAIISLLKIPLFNTINAYADFKSTMAFFQHIENFLLLPSTQDQRHGAHVEPDHVAEAMARLDPGSVNNEQRPLTRVIELRNVSVALQGSDKTVLEGINLDVEEGQLLMVAGPTGSGKSTLLRSLIGEGQVIDGSVYVQHEQTAYCDQNPWIWNSSIRDNIVGKSPFDKVWYNSILDACNLRNDLRRFAQYDEAPCGSEGSNLSGGQKQLVALARALYLRYPLIVLDDIFASLDSITARGVFQRLFGLNGLLKATPTTVVMATHSMQFLEAADQILVINNRRASAVKTYATDPAARRRVTELLQGNSRARMGRQHHSNIETPVVEMAQQSTLAAEGENSARSHGDIQLYMFYLRSFQRIGLTVCLVYTLLAASTEVFPDGYLRIWLELGQDSYWLYAGYMVLALLCPVFTRQSLRMWFSGLAPASAENLHQSALDTLMNATFHFISATDHGYLVDLFSHDITVTARGLPKDFLVTIYVSFALAVRVGIVCTATRYTAIIFPFVFTLLYKLHHYYLRTSRQIKHLQIVSKGPLYTQFAETARGLRHIRSFGWQRRNLQKTFELLDATQKPFYYMQSIQHWLTLVVDMTIFVSVVTLVVLATFFKLPGSGIGLSLVSLIPMNMEISKTLQQWTELEESLGSLDRVRNFVNNTPVEAVVDDDEIELPQKDKENGRVLFKNVVAKYSADDESPALNNVSFIVPAGWKVGIVGRTGSGKSSLLLTLLNFLDYTGHITIDGVDISKIPRDILRSKFITTVSQDSVNFDESVKYNLCPWTMSVSQEEEGNPNNLAMELLLTELGLWKVIGGEPGLYKKVSDLGLSHGQKQLLSIARGCMQHMTFDGNIVLMDEVTSNLDPETQDNVVRVLKEVFEDATVFMIAHRTETLRGVDLIMNVEDGRVFMTSKEDSDRQQREGRERERMRAPQMRYGWQPGNYPPDLAWHMMMAAERDIAYFDAQRRGEGPSQI